MDNQHKFEVCEKIYAAKSSLKKHILSKSMMKKEWHLNVTFAPNFLKIKNP